MSNGILDLSHSTVSDSEIGLILKSHPKITVLNISHCQNLTSIGIQRIALSLWDKQLVSLKTTRCLNPGIKPENWAQFIQLIDFTEIQELDLSLISCDFKSNEPLKQFAEVKPAILLAAKIKCSAHLILARSCVL